MLIKKIKYRKLEWFEYFLTFTRRRSFFPIIIFYNFGTNKLLNSFKCLNQITESIWNFPLRKLAVVFIKMIYFQIKRLPFLNTIIRKRQTETFLQNWKFKKSRFFQMEFAFELWSSKCCLKLQCIDKWGLCYFFKLF